MSRCLLVLTALSVCLLSGCGPSKGQVETEVKKGMEEKLGKKVSSLSLSENGKDAYSGNATLDNGDTYDLTVTVSGRTIEWKALPSKATLEKQARGLLESNIPGAKVTDLSLEKQPDGNYKGHATMTTGMRLALSGTWEGANFKLEWKPE
jgi:hypothetical protein